MSKRTNKSLDVSRRSLLRSVGAGVATTFGITIVSDISVARANPESMYIEEATNEEKRRISGHVEATNNFDLILADMRQDFRFRVSNQVSLYKTLNDDDELYYSGAFVAQDSPQNRQIELPFIYKSGDLVRVDGVAMEYQGKSLVGVDKYSLTSGTVKKTRLKPHSDQESYQVGTNDAAQPCGCGGSTPDICPYCKAVAGPMCYVGCGIGTSAICGLVSMGAPTDFTCFGVAAAVCTHENLCGRSDAAQLICEAAGLCQ